MRGLLCGLGFEDLRGSTQNEEKMKRDMIYRQDFSPLTWQGLRKWLEDQGIYEESFPVEFWAWIFFRLRQAEDKEEWFTTGKWAMIQRLEGLLDEIAKD